MKDIYKNLVEPLITERINIPTLIRSTRSPIENIVMKIQIPLIFSQYKYQ